MIIDSLYDCNISWIRRRGICGRHSVYKRLVSSEQKRFVLGIYSMGNAGTALSGSQLPRLQSLFGRDITFIIIASLLIIIAMVLYFGVKCRAGSQQRIFDLSVDCSIELRLTWDLSSVYAVTFGAFVAFGVCHPFCLKVSYGLSLTDAAARAAGFVLATISRPVGGWLNDKVGAKRVVQTALCAIIHLRYLLRFNQP